MKYQVRWLPEALAEFAEIWAEDPNRDAVSAAALAITQALELDPESKGRITNGYRVVCRFPLCAMYYVAGTVNYVWVKSVTRRFPHPP